MSLFQKSILRRCLMDKIVTALLDNLNRRLLCLLKFWKIKNTVDRVTKYKLCNHYLFVTYLDIFCIRVRLNRIVPVI